MKLKNDRRQLRKKDTADDEDNTSADALDTDMDEVLFKLKTLDISCADINELKKMLKLTFEHRQNVIKLKFGFTRKFSLLFHKLRFGKQKYSMSCSQCNSKS